MAVNVSTSIGKPSIDNVTKKLDAIINNLEQPEDSEDDDSNPNRKWEE